MGVPHVLIFPAPAQGHITPMLQLAEILSLLGIHVTFLNTQHNQRRLLRSPRVRGRLASRPTLRLLCVPDGLPEDNPRDASQTTVIIEALDASATHPLREFLMASRCGASSNGDAPPVTCIIADGVIRFAVDVAEELDIPIIQFRTSSAGYFWATHCIPNLISKGIIPFQDGCDLDELVACVPGMETFLRRRDLPSFFQIMDVEDTMTRILRETVRNESRYRGLILNTTEFAESNSLTFIRRQEIPSTYSIGPLHGLLRTIESLHGSAGKVGDGEDAPSSEHSTSLWQEDRTCLKWLDARPPASVVYVNLGSMTLLKREQLLELWHGLVNSGYPFLWVARPGLVEEGGWGGDVLPEAVAEGTQQRVFVQEGWAPQREVLTHPAVGCFLTHSGWNSTLESMWEGVPMVCWPNFADQKVNSRFVSEVWRVGVDTKDTGGDRAAVEKALREVMEGERASDMRAAVSSMSKAARDSAREGGSSYANLERLIRDIRAMSSEGSRDLI